MAVWEIHFLVCKVKLFNPKLLKLTVIKVKKLVITAAGGGLVGDMGYGLEELMAELQRKSVQP